jgi:hypothetical protein
MKRLVYVSSLVVFLALALGLPALATTNYFQGFETNTADWSGVNRVPSGTAGITSAAGVFHAELTVGASYTLFGGYESTFPTNGYTTSIDIYLDVDASYANDTRFDWDSAISTPTSDHRRDFIFNAGFYNDSVAPGSGPRFVISASNNSSPGSAYPKNSGRNPISITTTGWYTFEHHFTNNGSGILTCELSITTLGVPVPGATWTLSDPTDVIGTTVGGHRYGWFDCQQFLTLAIDNVNLSSSPNYNFNGFFAPVDNPLVVNAAKAGSSIPVKFSLGGDQGLNIFVTTSPFSQKIECEEGSLTDLLETTTAGNSSLSYDPATDQYTYIWKTEKSWKNSCRQLTLVLSDGSQHTALFSFK